VGDYAGGLFLGGKIVDSAGVFPTGAAGTTESGQSVGELCRRSGTRQYRAGLAKSKPGDRADDCVGIGGDSGEGLELHRAVEMFNTDPLPLGSS